MDGEFWIMAIFVTSDTHFNHEKIIGYCNRPFSDAKEMNEVLINNWNETVGPEDTVYHLGDFAMGGPARICPIFDQLNGYKILIRGNHDYLDRITKVGFPQIICHGIILPLTDNLQVEMVHRPIQSLTSLPTLCGHVHDLWKSIKPGDKPIVLHFKDEHVPAVYSKKNHWYINVGVDNWGFKPVNIQTIIELLT